MGSGRLEGLGEFDVRLDTRVRRLDTSGLLLDTRLDPNFTDWQTGLGLGRPGRCENGSINWENWDRTGARAGLEMADWDYQTGASLIYQTGHT